MARAGPALAALGLYLWFFCYTPLSAAQASLLAVFVGSQAVGYSSAMALPPSHWRQSDFEAFFRRWEENTARYDSAGWQAHGLGRNWPPHVDEATGRTYWWHTVTRETRWDQPQTEPLPAGWKCYLDPDTGNYWYHQQDTGFWR